jgi:hypothetical protein
MPEPKRSAGRRGPAAPVAVVAALVLLVGVLLGLVPFLLKQQQRRASVADATATGAKLSTSAFAIAPRQRACMNSVTVTPNAALATFQLATAAAPERTPAAAAARKPAAATESEGPSLELTITAPGYRALSTLPSGGYGKQISFQIVPPRKPVIGTACIVNLGLTPLALEGTTDLGATSRSVLTIDGRPAVGNLTLIFDEKHERSRVAHLGVVAEHISNLTDQFVPVWLVWVLAACLVVGLPVGIVVAFQRAVREDDAAAGA